MPQAGDPPFRPATSPCHLLCRPACGAGRSTLPAPAEYLDNDDVVAAYLTAAMEDPNPDVFLAAVGDVGCADSAGVVTRPACVALVVSWAGVTGCLLAAGCDHRAGTMAEAR